MSETTKAAVLPGWFTLDERAPQLIGSRCADCGTYYFPARSLACRNPACGGSKMENVPLSRTGKIWSFTDACYQPPEPYIVQDEPFQPFAIAAVELAAERMVVLGQVVRGVGVDQLHLGMDMELVLETLYEKDGTAQLIWKWKPV
jgi:uncharacterized OB-fold protein